MGKARIVLGVIIKEVAFLKHHEVNLHIRRVKKEALWRHLIRIFACGYVVLFVGQMGVAEAGHGIILGGSGKSPFPAESGTYIKLFGCYMPLPPGYFLHTDTKSSGKFEFNRLEPIGFLRVGSYEPVEDEKIDVVSEKPIGHLTIVRIRGKAEFFRSRPTVTVMHDGRKSLSIGGPDQDWAEPMAEYCVDHMAPD